MTDPYHQVSKLAGLEVRFAKAADAGKLSEWLLNPEVARAMPLGEVREVEDTAPRWVALGEKKTALAAVYRGELVGLAFLFVQTYQRILHQASHILIVDPHYRQLGVGTALLNELEHHGKEEFNVELAHCEVYGDEETVQWYRRRGYVEFARQEGWIKEEDTYLNRVCLEKYV